METSTSQLLRPYLESHLNWLYVNSDWWLAVGFLGNVLFGSRFLFQWLASEKKRCLVVPVYFWHLSFWGSMLNLIYCLHLDNAPLILGVAALPFIYGRNLVLLRKSAPTPRQEVAPFTTSYNPT